MPGFPRTSYVELSFQNHTYDTVTARKIYRKYSCEHLAQFLVYSGCSTNVLEGNVSQWSELQAHSFKWNKFLNLSKPVSWTVQRGVSYVISRCSSSSSGLGLMLDCLSIHIPTYLWAPSGHRQFLSIQDGRSHSCVLRSCHYSDTSNWRTVWASPPGRLGHRAGTGGRGAGSLRSLPHTCPFPMRSHSGRCQAQTRGTGLGSTHHFSVPRWWHTLLETEPKPGE